MGESVDKKPSDFRLTAAVLIASGAAWLLSGILNFAALVAMTANVQGNVVPGALYYINDNDSWMFSLLAVLSFTLMGILAISAAVGLTKGRYWARSIGASFSLMGMVSGILLAVYALPLNDPLATVYTVLLLLSSLFHLVLLVHFFKSKAMEEAFPVWVSRYGRSASQFSLLFLINATAFGSLVIGPLLPLLRFRHQAGAFSGVPLCSIGSITRAISGNWADLLLAPIFLIAVLMLVGITIGRALCGWACPIGFLQDLAARAKGMAGIRDIEFSRKTHERLKLLKYALLIFVLLLAINIGVSLALSPDGKSDFISGLAGFPLFQSGATPCEACPAPITGYFLPDDIIRNSMRGTLVLTPEAYLRLIVLVVFVAGAFAMPRFFCRYICQAGAMASLFNKTSALSIEKEQEKCTECNYCVTACPMRVHRLKEEHVDSRVHDMECTFCLECIDSCPEQALSLQFQGKTIYKGGKEWWLKTLKETEHARAAAGTAPDAKAEPPKPDARKNTSPDGKGPEKDAPGKAQEKKEDGPSSGTKGSGGPGLVVALVTILLLGTLTPIMPVASGSQYNATNLPIRDSDGNYTLGTGDVWTVSTTKLTVNGNVLLEMDSKLVVENGAELTINGDLWVTGRSSLVVNDSTLRVNIPEQPPMRIEHIYAAPNGFMLVDETASVNLTNSKFVLKRLQEPLMQGIARPGYGTSAENYTYKITYTDPANRPLPYVNVVVDGTVYNMSKDNIDDTTSRDGILYGYTRTLAPGNHSYHFEGAGPDGPLRYPQAGELCGPHVDTDQPTFLFGSEYLVNFGSFVATGTTLDMVGSFYTHMSSIFMMTKSSINAGLVIEINSHCEFRESNIPTMVVKERTARQNVFLYDCTVETAVMESYSGTLFERCTITTLDCQTESTTTVVSSTIRFFNSGGNASATLDSTNVLAQDFPFMRMIGNSQVTAFNNSKIGRAHLDDNARLFLTFSSVETLEACDDVKVWSEYGTIGTSNLVDNATILQTLKLRATLNGAPAAVSIDVFRKETGQLLVSTTTRDDGFRSFAVPIRITTENGTTMIDLVTVKVKYQSLQNTQEFSLQNGTLEINVTLEDRAPPTLRNINFDYYYKPAGEASVSADIDDGQGTGVMGAWVRYTLDGKKWSQKQMYRTGITRYECNFTGLKSATEVQYRVHTVDWLNNSGTSKVLTESVGLPPSTLTGGLLVLMALVAVIAVYMLYLQMKRKSYVQGRRSRRAAMSEGHAPVKQDGEGSPEPKGQEPRGAGVTGDAPKGTGAAPDDVKSLEIRGSGGKGDGPGDAK